MSRERKNRVTARLVADDNGVAEPLKNEQHKEVAHA